MTDTRELTAVPQTSEPLVTRRMPSLTEESLSVLSRRDPIRMRPGASLADCLAAIQRSGTVAAEPVDSHKLLK